jgi:hypothetical protein
VHDGWIQFELVDQTPGWISEVFLAPAKHFKVWLNDEAAFRLILQRHQVPESKALESIDEYPRTTIGLSGDQVSLGERGRLFELIRQEIVALSRIVRSDA